MSQTASVPPEPTTGSLKTLFQDLRRETSELLRKEVELARTEVSERASRLGGDVARLAVGGFIAYAGLLVLFFGLGDLVAALLERGGMDEETALWIGRIAVGLVVALIGWLMFARAKKAMKSDGLVPEQTLRSMRENKQWMQTKLQHSHEPI